LFGHSDMARSARAVIVRVIARSCSEFVRARCPSWLDKPRQAACVLHVVQELR